MAASLCGFLLCSDTSSPSLLFKEKHRLAKRQTFSFFLLSSLRRERLLWRSAISCSAPTPRRQRPPCSWKSKKSTNQKIIGLFPHLFLLRRRSFLWFRRFDLLSVLLLLAVSLGLVAMLLFCVHINFFLLLGLALAAVFLLCFLLLLSLFLRSRLLFGLFLALFLLLVVRLNFSLSFNLLLQKETKIRQSNLFFVPNALVPAALEPLRVLLWPLRECASPSTRARPGQKPLSSGCAP